MDAKNLILYNMISNGDVTFEKEDHMAVFQPVNENIRIELERKNASLWNTDNSTKYLCIFKFIDNLSNRVILECIASELDIFNMLDSVEQWSSFNYYYESYITLSRILPNGNFYTFNFNINYEYDDLQHYVMIVKEFDKKTQMYYDRVRIEFDYSNEANYQNDKSLYGFLDLLFFIFLIDIASDYPQYNYENNYIENLLFK